MSGFSNPCSDTGHILNFVKKNLSQIYKEGYLYHKGGVMLVDLVPNNIHQKNLFERYDYQRSDSRMIVVDRINQKFGPGTLFYAAAGLKKDGDWQSRTHHLSPRYTTKWGELPHVC
jgi:DNA polymerase V